MEKTIFMFCEECGAEIDDTAKFCDKCGTPISKSVKDENIKKNNVINISSKGKWAILIGVIILVVIICVSLMYMEQESRETTISGTTRGSYSASVGNDFTIIGDIEHKNMFGDVEIEDETLEVVIKDKNGKVVDQKTQKNGGEYKFKDLPLGKCTVEFNYIGGDYPAAKDTKEIKVISKEEVWEKAAKDSQARQENLRVFSQMYNAVF